MKIRSVYNNIAQLKLGKVVLSSLLLFAILLFSHNFFIKSAHAVCTECEDTLRDADDDLWMESQIQFDEYLDREFKEVEEFIIQEMWEQSILPVMMEAANEFTVVAMQQAMIIGMFIDAESQMKAQRLLQEIQAKAHKDYHPSVGMCEFGSLMKSLAYSELRGETYSVVYSKRSLDRQLGKGETGGAYGTDLDQQTRILQFQNLFCNRKDRNGALITVCDNLVSWGNAAFDELQRDRINKDIDYFSLLDDQWSMNVDLTNQEIFNPTASPAVLDQDEEHILALNNNLFAHTLFARPPAKLLYKKPGSDLSTMQRLYIDMRSVIAKRSVAENSFYALTAMKSPAPELLDTAGDPIPQSSRLYMEHILSELGIPAAEILTMMGEKPSYYSQMEVLTKKLYQNPDFYTNLYDKPANVERKSVALQAIKLMQKFDMLKSHLRGEASTSILLEIAVLELQSEVEDQIQALEQ